MPSHDQNFDFALLQIFSHHPEEELKKAGVIFQSETAFRDVFATLTVVDAEA